MCAVIGHLDADCFYVSCERVRFPCLRGQPVGVLGGNQGVFVIAKSYELKRLGVTTTRMNVMADRLSVEGERQLSLFNPDDGRIDRIKALVAVRPPQRRNAAP